MGWIKQGRILNVDNNYDWMVTHATIPIFFPIDDRTCRIYYSTRNKEGKSYPAYALFDTDTWEIIKISERPLLGWGRPGSFDDNGIMFSSLVPYEDKVYAYYIGWNQAMPVAYHLSIGLAISYDGGETFEKYSDGPLLDRALDEPIFNTAPCVLYNDGRWEMWYVSCTHWIRGEEKMEPVYYVRYASSADGIHWEKNDKPCIDYKRIDEAIGRPWVMHTRGGGMKCGIPAGIH